MLSAVRTSQRRLSVFRHGDAHEDETDHDDDEADRGHGRSVDACGAARGNRRSGAEATVTLVDARRDGVIAMPVAAIVDERGSPEVRVAQASGPDRIVPVDTGLVADGWVEITAGLYGGEEIRLPGSSTHTTPPPKGDSE